MIKELSTWIVSRVNGLGTVPALVLGGNVQVGFRAVDAPVRCHAFLESGGPVYFDLPDRVDYMLQIATRGATYQQAREDAWVMFKALHGTAGWNIPALSSGGQAYTAQTIEAMAAPQWIGQNEKFNHEFSCNYLIRMKKANT